MNEEEKDSIEILKNTDLDINTIYSIDLHTYNYAVKTVLNLLEKKDKEMQFQKDINKTEQDRHKKTEKSLKGQIIKQNKIIDEMAKGIYIEIDKYKNPEDVKQYFERKVENGNIF